MLAIWNTTHKAEIDRLASEAFADDFHFVDPNFNIVGPQAFIDMVHIVQKEIPGAVYSRASKPKAHNNHYFYRWEIHRGQHLIMPGHDVSEVNDHGKIIKVTGFFGELE